MFERTQAKGERETGKVRNFRLLAAFVRLVRLLAGQRRSVQKTKTGTRYFDQNAADVTAMNNKVGP